jgi:predicted SAM-dependent methyltransferase
MKKSELISSMVRFASRFLRMRFVQLKNKRDLLNLSRQPVKRIIVGSGGKYSDGWVATDKASLNLLIEGDWARYFHPDSLDAILAEHVWEHLTPEEAITAATCCFRFLKPGGYLRVAVPDGYHPDPNYIGDVKPGGSGAGADDHKVLYTYDTFRNVFISVGFEVSLWEYFDEHGTFHNLEWNPADGMIQRSIRFDSRNFTRTLTYTSIVLDAKKP